MAMSQTMTNFLSSVTGNVNKAYLLLNNKPSKLGLTPPARAESFQAQLANEALRRENGLLRNAAASLQNASGLAGSSGNTSLFGTSANVTAKANQAASCPYRYSTIPPPSAWNRRQEPPSGRAWAEEERIPTSRWRCRRRRFCAWS